MSVMLEPNKPSRMSILAHTHTKSQFISYNNHYYFHYYLISSLVSSSARLKWPLEPKLQN